MNDEQRQNFINLMVERELAKIDSVILNATDKDEPLCDLAEVVRTLLITVRVMLQEEA